MGLGLGEDAFLEDTVFLGLVMLASLYHNLHDFAYCGSCVIGTRATLLHI